MQALVTRMDFEKYKHRFARGQSFFQPLEGLLFLAQFSVSSGEAERRNLFALLHDFFHPVELSAAVEADYFAGVAYSARLDLSLLRAVLAHPLANRLHRFLVHSLVNISADQALVSGGRGRFDFKHDFALRDGVVE